jgi:DNA-binding transcriptional ArsR family regulator
MKIASRRCAPYAQAQPIEKISPDWGGSTLSMGNSAVGRKPLRERKRQPAEALTHSVNHWIRVEVLAILHEGEYSAGEIAEMIGEDVKLVGGHIRDLYDSGCIELAGYRMGGNHRKPIYRAIVLPVISDAVARAMSAEERHDVSGAIAQGILAETVSSYRSNKLDEAEDVCLMWDAPNLDAEGRREMQAHLIEAWRGAREIHARAANRMARSGEVGTTTVVGLLGFERGRPGRPDGGYKLRKK